MASFSFAWWQVCWLGCGNFLVSCRRRRALTISTRKTSVTRLTGFSGPIVPAASSRMSERLALCVTQIYHMHTHTLFQWLLDPLFYYFLFSFTHRFTGCSHLLPHPPDVCGSQLVFEGCRHTCLQWKCAVGHQICASGSCCVHRREKGVHICIFFSYIYFLHCVCSSVEQLFCRGSGNVSLNLFSHTETCQSHKLHGNSVRNQPVCQIHWHTNTLLLQILKLCDSVLGQKEQQPSKVNKPKLFKYI